jgi:hypothetical protein
LQRTEVPKRVTQALREDISERRGAALAHPARETIAKRRDLTSSNGTHSCLRTRSWFDFPIVRSQRFDNRAPPS